MFSFPNNEFCVLGAACLECNLTSSYVTILTDRVPWESIQNMASLHTLNLDHNLIDHIAEGVFGELYKLARLDMTSNRLRTLPPDPLFAR